MLRRALVVVVFAAFVLPAAVASLGCGSNKGKVELPTNRSQPLPGKPHIGSENKIR